jgi:hypothetical protein
MFHRLAAVALLGIGLQVAATNARAQTVLANSSFPISNEGWTSLDPSGSSPASHAPLVFGGGGGHIFNEGGSTKFGFGAPAEFLGNQSAALGGTLRFRLFDGSNTAGQDGSVRLSGGGVELQNPQSATPGQWTSFEIALAPGQWFVGDPAAGVQATWADLGGVLSNMGSLSIFGGNLGGELNTALDDVTLTTAVPEPGSWALMSAGLLVLGRLAAKRRVLGSA